MRRVVITALLLAACKGAPEHDDNTPVSVKCVVPERRDVADVVVLRGRVQPPPGGDLAIAAQVPGRIASVDVREGQSLSPGDVVATLEDASSRDVVRQANAALAQVQANEANARATLERVKALVARGIAAKQELDDAQTRADALKADVNAARASADLAQRSLGRVVVRSSFAGTVTHLFRGRGAIVDGTAATPIVQLAASSVVEVVADATVIDLTRISPDDDAKTTLVTGVTVSGTVISRSSALDPATGLGTVRVALAGAPPNIVLGTFGSTAITVAHRPGVLTVPTRALRGAVADGAEVVVCSNNKAEVRRVEVGFRDAEHVEVRGVGEGERVATERVLGLENDQPIQVTE